MRGDGIRYGALAAATAALVWHFRGVSLSAHETSGSFPWLTTLVALAASMVALQVWFGDRTS
jgi:hypothetical protein